MARVANASDYLQQRSGCGARFTSGEGCVGQAFSSKRIVHLTSLRHGAFLRRELAATNKIKSIVFVPVPGKASLRTGRAALRDRKRPPDAHPGSHRERSVKTHSVSFTFWEWKNFSISSSDENGNRVFCWKWRMALGFCHVRPPSNGGGACGRGS